MAMGWCCYEEDAEDDGEVQAFLRALEVPLEASDWEGGWNARLLTTGEEDGEIWSHPEEHEHHDRWERAS